MRSELRSALSVPIKAALSIILKSFQCGITPLLLAYYLQATVEAERRRRNGALGRFSLFKEMSAFGTLKKLCSLSSGKATDDLVDTNAVAHLGG
jgi:hypothetical protein